LRIIESKRKQISGTAEMQDSMIGAMQEDLNWLALPDFIFKHYLPATAAGGDRSSIHLFCFRAMAIV
jgi:hypothetical protein